MGQTTATLLVVEIGIQVAACFRFPMICLPEQSHLKMANLLPLAICTLVLGSAHAAQTVGAPHNDGLFLYRQPVEQFWNDWTAVAVVPRSKTSDQAEIRITGEGKTVDFSGHLIIQCRSDQQTWKNASNFRNAITKPADLSALVPLPVLKNARSVFCK
jgi:hypothetical protein